MTEGSQLVSPILPEAWLIDPECRIARRLASHQCQTRDGAPIRLGQPCYYEVRLGLLADIEAKAVDAAIAALGHSVSTFAASSPGTTAPVVDEAASHVGGAGRIPAAPAPLAHLSDQPAAGPPTATGHLRASNPRHRGAMFRPEGDSPAGGDVCAQCGAGRPDKVTIAYGGVDWGFCGLACACIWVRSNWMGGASGTRAYIHPICRSAAHWSCPLPLACGCPCHIEQSGRTLGEPELLAVAQ